MVYVHKYSSLCICTISQDYNAMERIIAYYRVSTDKQGKSGLGLEGQKAIVSRYAKHNNLEIAGEFVEVESGSRNNRAELEKALKACKKVKGFLVVAKLDRLSRTVFLISKLMESKLPFVVADKPNASKMELQLNAVFAEEELRRMSERQKDSIAAYKARGGEWGKYGKVLAAENKTSADEHAKQVRPIIADIRDAGHTSVRAITAEMNRKEIPTARGGQWHVNTVQRLLKRIERLQGVSA